LFREVYDAVSQKSEEQVDFSMNPTDFIGGHNTWLSTLLSKTVLIYYLSLLITMIAVIVFLINK